MINSLPTIAIVGRTNVGKSTLFNLMSGQDIAIVEDKPGVTRDRNYIVLNNFTHPFCLVDTGGLLGEQEETLADAVREQTEIAIEESDLIIAVFDGEEGLHPLDKDVANLLRKSKKPVVWVANKCEKEESKLKANELFRLGIDDLICISAAHNDGIRNIFKAVWSKLGIDQESIKVKRPNKRSNINIAILGKPNVGKSTFVNKLIGEDRLVTSPISGTTRDSVNINLTRDGQEYCLIDTAGLRRKSRIEKKTVEKISTFRTLRAVAMCDIALIVIDATEGAPSDQDAKIAELVDQRGKGIIIVVNKWDAVEKDHKTAKEFEEKVLHTFRFCSYAPVIFISALTGRRCPSVLKKAGEIFELGRERIKTSDLNTLIGNAVTKNAPPIYRGLPVKFYFASQIASHPPTFILFFNQPKRISDSYERYLKNFIRSKYPFPGYDIKIIPRKRRSKFDTPENSN